MKIAITDACIFIDLFDLQLTSAFFGLELEVHTSFDVFNELYIQHQEVLKAFQSVGKLIIHAINEEDRKRISQMGYPNGLSANDKTVLYLASKFDAMLLSSDKTVRHNAKIRKIEYHGMLWVFDKLLDSSLVSYQEATEKLKKLIMTNIIYRNNSELVSEMNSRLKKWQKHFSS
ncbi:MAG: hypothetical protein J0H85_07485 [Sediminibacterium magnilacihabitans]|nr:hypothetical protein [Sediminibacterium magnilacihabitans]PQV60571.1 hypothetical protein CLV53_1065 [Sediminibacterium magnilacihabitans]